MKVAACLLVGSSFALAACGGPKSGPSEGGGGVGGEGGQGMSSSGGEGGGQSGGGGSGGSHADPMLTEAHCPGGAPSLAVGTPIVFGGGGTDGRTARTSDGASWIDVTTVSQGPTFEGHSRNLIRGVGYGGGVFVAVGGLDNAYVVTSCDGEHYRQDVMGTNIEGEIPPALASFLSGVAYKEGVFAAAGGGGLKLISKDHGLTWIPQGGTDPGHLRGIAAGNGLFVATGHLWEGDQGMITTSTDGDTWTPAQISAGALGGVRFGNGVFVALGAARCARSSDGAVWEDCGLPAGSSFIGLLFVKGAFYVQRNDGTFSSSEDGANWTEANGWLPGSIAPLGDLFVMTAWGARGYSDGDLLNWTTTDFPPDQNVSSLVAGEILFAP